MTCSGRDEVVKTSVLKTQAENSPVWHHLTGGDIIDGQGAIDSGSCMRPIRDIGEWGELFAAVARPSIVQSEPYGDAVKRTRGFFVRHYAFEYGQRIVAICQVRTKYLAGMPIASRIEQGPMFLDETPSLDIRRNVLGLVRSSWRLFKGGSLKIQPALEDTQENRSLLKTLGYRDMKKQAWCSARIDLSLSEEQLRQQLLRPWRRHLNAACRKGLQLQYANSLDQASWLLEMHEANTRNKGFIGPGKDFLHALSTSMHSGFHVLSVCADGKPVTAACWIRNGPVAQCLISAIGATGRELDAGNFLFWNGILEMKKAGCRWLDLGGLQAGQGYNSFKQGMGGAEYKLIGEWLSY